MIKLVNLVRNAIVIVTVAFFAACGASDSDSSSSQVDFSELSPDNIVVGSTVVSLYESDDELNSKLGNKYAEEFNEVSNRIQKDTFIMKLDEGETHEMKYVSFSNCNPEYHGDEVICFNEINGKSTLKEVKKILGEKCLSFENSNNTDFFCYFVDGKEIDYSKVNVPDGFMDTMGVCPYGRAYCEDLLEKGEAKSYIEWKFLQKGEYFDCICTIYEKI